MLCAALLQDIGCSVSGYDEKSKDEGNHDYSGRVEWFDPFKVTSMDEYLDLPEYWQAVFRNQNAECWRCGYRYVHVPKDIICYYPHLPIKGIFIVVNSKATFSGVTGHDLIHSGGQFVEYDTKDKGLWMGRIEDNAECEREENGQPTEITENK